MSYELSENAKAALMSVIDAQRLAMAAGVSAAQIAAVLHTGNTPKPV